MQTGSSSLAKLARADTDTGYYREGRSVSREAIEARLSGNNSVVDGSEGVAKGGSCHASMMAEQRDGLEGNDVQREVVELRWSWKRKR